VRVHIGDQQTEFHLRRSKFLNFEVVPEEGFKPKTKGLGNRRSIDGEHQRDWPPNGSYGTIFTTSPVPLKMLLLVT
jgi:hypothetical protein